MSLTDILALVALLVGIGDLVLIWTMRKKTSELVERIEEKDKTVMMNDMFIPFRHDTNNPETIEEGIRSIARVVKDDLVMRYEIKNVATVKELVEEIRKSDMDSDLKDELLDFFNKVAYTIYSDDITDDTVENIKKSSRSIISKMREGPQ